MYWLYTFIYIGTIKLFDVSSSFCSGIVGVLGRFVGGCVVANTFPYYFPLNQNYQFHTKYYNIA